MNLLFICLQQKRCIESTISFDYVENKQKNTTTMRCSSMRQCKVWISHQTIVCLFFFFSLTNWFKTTTIHIFVFEIYTVYFLTHCNCLTVYVCCKQLILNHFIFFKIIFGKFCIKLKSILRVVKLTYTINMENNLSMYMLLGWLRFFILKLYFFCLK